MEPCVAFGDIFLGLRLEGFMKLLDLFIVGKLSREVGRVPFQQSPYVLEFPQGGVPYN